MVPAVLPSLVQHDARCSNDLLAPPCVKPKPPCPWTRAAPPGSALASHAPAATKASSSSSAHARVVELHGLARAPMLMAITHRFGNARLFVET